MTSSSAVFLIKSEKNGQISISDAKTLARLSYLEGKLEIAKTEQTMANKIIVGDCIREIQHILGTV